MNHIDNIEDTPSHNSPLKENFLSFFYDVFDTVLRGLIIVFIIFIFVFKTPQVVGPSMMNTLHDGDKLIITNLFYEPAANDIVVFHDTNHLNELVVKRIIATGNTWVRIDFDNQKVFVSSDDNFEDHEIIDESAYIYLDTGYYNQKGAYNYYVPEGYLFVMGDNRNHSSDSRSDLIGFVDEKSVIGKVIFRIYPFDRIGIVK